VAVIAKITPDGGIARLVAEPAATSFVAVEPVAQPAAVEELADPELPSVEASATPAASPTTAAAEE